jgi:hypothetical protein
MYLLKGIILHFSNHNHNRIHSAVNPTSNSTTITNPTSPPLQVHNQSTMATIIHGSTSAKSYSHQPISHHRAPLLSSCNSHHSMSFKTTNLQFNSPVHPQSPIHSATTTITRSPELSIALGTHDPWLSLQLRRRRLWAPTASCRSPAPPLCPNPLGLTLPRHH